MKKQEKCFDVELYIKANGMGNIDDKEYSILRKLEMPLKNQKEESVKR